MDHLYADLIRLLIENYFNAADSLALFCVSKKFAGFSSSYREILLNAKIGWDYCVKNGKLTACQFLYRTTNIDIHANNDEAFQWSCDNGHLAMAQWFYQVSINTNKKINIHDRNELTFRWSCHNGHLVVVQWLYQLSTQINSPIDIHAMNEGAFQWSCDNGHSAVAQWLYQLSIDISSPIDPKILSTYGSIIFD